jgi:hypothetical protein
LNDFLFAPWPEHNNPGWRHHRNPRFPLGKPRPCNLPDFLGHGRCWRGRPARFARVLGFRGLGADGLCTGSAGRSATYRANSLAATKNGSMSTHAQKAASEPECCLAWHPGTGGSAPRMGPQSGTANRSSGFWRWPVYSLPISRFAMRICAACVRPVAPQTQHGRVPTKAKKPLSRTRGCFWRSSVTSQRLPLA